MEMIALTQKEIRALLTFMECRDVEEWSDILDLPELLTLHSKLTSAQTYWYEWRRHSTVPPIFLRLYETFWYWNPKARRLSKSKGVYHFIIRKESSRTRSHCWLLYAGVSMTNKERIILAQMQIDNLLNLTKELQYQGFLTSHLLPVRYELQRQLHLLTSTQNYNRIEE